MIRMRREWSRDRDESGSNYKKKEKSPNNFKRSRDENQPNQTQTLVSLSQESLSYYGEGYHCKNLHKVCKLYMVQNKALILLVLKVMGHALGMGRKSKNYLFWMYL